MRDSWIVTRYQLVQEILRNTTDFLSGGFKVERERHPEVQAILNEIPREVPMLVMPDAPQHTRRRLLMQGARRDRGRGSGPRGCRPRDYRKLADDDALSPVVQSVGLGKGSGRSERPPSPASKSEWRSRFSGNGCRACGSPNRGYGSGRMRSVDSPRHFCSNGTLKLMLPPTRLGTQPAEPAPGVPGNRTAMSRPLGAESRSPFVFLLAES
jgi:hypothetical protein